MPGSGRTMSNERYYDRMAPKEDQRRSQEWKIADLEAFRDIP